MRLPRRSSLKRSALATGSVVAAAGLLLAGCGSKATEENAANAESCVDTSGCDHQGRLAALADRHDGDQRGRGARRRAAGDRRDQRRPAACSASRSSRSSRTARPTGRRSPRRPRSCISSDKVAAVFGGWTSASRKAMLPVFEGNKGLLYYPVQYEGLESSPNIFYTGATTNQQIIPALDYLKEQGHQEAVPRRLRLRLPAHGEQGDQGLRRGQRHDDRRRGVPAARRRPTSPRSSTRSRTPSRTPCSTPSTATRNVAFFKQLQGQGHHAGRRCQSSRSRSPRKRSAASASRTSPASSMAWNYYQTTDSPANTKFVAAYKAKYGAEPHDRRPDRGRLHLGVPVEGRGREGRSRSTSRRQGSGRWHDLRRPRGQGHVDGENQHIYKTARIGKIRADGLIDEVWESDGPDQARSVPEDLPLGQGPG